MKATRGMGWMVEHLSSKYEALSSNLSTSQKFFSWVNVPGKTLFYLFYFLGVVSPKEF
jgi:hypothetical protein